MSSHYVMSAAFDKAAEANSQQQFDTAKKAIIEVTSRFRVAYKKATPSGNSNLFAVWPSDTQHVGYNARGNKNRPRGRGQPEYCTTLKNAKATTVYGGAPSSGAKPPQALREMGRLGQHCFVFILGNKNGRPMIEFYAIGKKPQMLEINDANISIALDNLHNAMYSFCNPREQEAIQQELGHTPDQFSALTKN